jgi:hypothetical protein
LLRVAESTRELAQVGIDAGLPSAAGLAIGRENIVIETKLHRLLWVFQRRAATLDDFVAVAGASSRRLEPQQA